MRIKNFVTVLAFLIFTSALFLSCGKDSQWVANLNGDKITLGEFNSLYYANQKSIYADATNEEIDRRAASREDVQKNPTLDKRQFLDNLISQKLVYNKAVDEGTLKNQEVQALIQMAKETVVLGYYVKEKFKNQIEITDQDVSKVYTAQKDRFKNYPIEQAEQYIRQQLYQQKMQLKLREMVETLKEEGGIKRNLDLIPAVKDASPAAENKDTAKEPVKEAPKQ